MYKICVVTATRAEYGVLKNTLKEINESSDLELCLLVTGMHLSNKYGHTIDEIEQDGFEIEEEIDILESGTEQQVIKTMSNALVKFGDAFKRLNPDMLVVVGDRYEILAVCETAMILKIPIAHISGGEVTEGAVDDTIRHCITKMSCLHFPACEIYRKRIIQMGEQPDTVFNYGDVGVENIYNMKYMDKSELESYIQLDLSKKYACVTFHPTTLDIEPPERQIEEVLMALSSFQDIQFIFTGANADAGGEIINHKIEHYVSEHKNCKYFASLGIQRYLSLLKDSLMIIGNSSSGIIEAPCFGIPTVNIGVRQKGRLQAAGIINCSVDHNEIIEAIKYAKSPQGREKAYKAVNPYGRGNTSKQIVKEIKSFLENGKNCRKRFWDMNVIE